MKTFLNLRKLCLAAVLTAVCVATSTFSIPVGASRCFPVQHLCNILAGVFLGPWYSTAMAFCASLLRNLMGTGTLLAFPGSMAGALLGGILYQYCGHKLYWLTSENWWEPVFWAAYSHGRSQFLSSAKKLLFLPIFSRSLSAVQAEQLLLFFWSAHSKRPVHWTEY